MAYATLTQLKAYLKMPPATTTDDVLLERLIATAQAVIEGPGSLGTNRKFEAPTDSTRYFDALRDVEGTTLMFDHDICQIESIVNGDGTTLSASDYTTKPRNETPWYAIRLKLSSGKLWMFDTDPEDSIHVTGRWAHSITPPPLIVEATIQLAAYYYKLKDSQVFDTVANPEMGTLTVPSGAPKSVKLILDGFRRLV